MGQSDRRLPSQLATGKCPSGQWILLRAWQNRHCLVALLGKYDYKDGLFCLNP